ncbi:hypothetical protein ACXIUK_22910 [Vibrio parahaemolyticus]|uniref:hypothetical protein n=1 Tax=Vibrio parahaemolyticus TaxID=670 RepID=UPI00186AAFB0|nr:hypothetical protein [Vibrio parahaemolyticus]EKB1967810.1 hypothetical protein [Vibrio parahaemolyticus]ELA8094061.1 hypothetical protein [Vibrio parahaemolyticus]ELA9340274.1 hypothetical protein [Vibrio parahaemolyticus]MBE4408621.1 hypothetical protein [Vibrio parahaemolyticus]MBM4801406.1 hypothetical protein [Vibrio parahaemolyticus]
MKRYRILSFDFDSRAHSLEPIQEQWDEVVKEQHRKNQERTIKGLVTEFGEYAIEQKVNNFKELKFKPFSVAAFHNKFLEQVRRSYVMGCYYPALTGACALGERILNHMVLLLRDYHKDAPEYKKLYRKQSFDYWPQAIDALEGWGHLLPEAAEKFRELNEKRNRAIHFNPETDHNDKELALEAIHVLQSIVEIQFSAFGNQPWYFCIPGEMYIKKEWEDHPLIMHVFIPNCLYVGPNHRVDSISPQVRVSDLSDYEDRAITDEEFTQLRTSC